MHPVTYCCLCWIKDKLRALNRLKKNNNEIKKKLCRCIFFFTPAGLLAAALWWMWRKCLYRLHVYKIYLHHFYAPCAEWFFFFFFIPVCGAPCSLWPADPPTLLSPRWAWAPPEISLPLLFLKDNSGRSGRCINKTFAFKRCSLKQSQIKCMSPASFIDGSAKM